MTKRKWALGIGIVAMVGAAWWMRELASWRPKTFAKVDFAPAQLRFSRDGKRLIATDGTGNSGQIFNWKSGAVDWDAASLRYFDDEVTFPRFGFDEDSNRLIFSAAPHKNVLLHDLGVGRDVIGLQEGQSSRCGWSKLRREVYLNFMGEIYIWNWDDGNLKRRVRYAKDGLNDAVFSPDGQWLIAAHYDKTYNGFMRRYKVQSGKMVALINQYPEFGSFQFSPDGRFFWFVQRSARDATFNVLRADNWQWLTGAKCAGPVKWLSDNRVGIVQAKSFEWLDMQNPDPYSNQRQIPGPSEGTTDWALSPDGNWIYSVEQSGVIRKWRAR